LIIFGSIYKVDNMWWIGLLIFIFYPFFLETIFFIFIKIFCTKNNQILLHQNA
jgi:hypothetical protein